MDKVFVDTNIVLDLLAERKAFLPEAQALFTASDRGTVELFISSLTFANAYYVLAQQLRPDKARKVLRKFKVLVNILPMDNKIIDLSLDSEFKDLEDAIQYYIALENRLDLILTRNLKDFKSSKLPVLSAKDYMEKRKESK